MKKDVIFECPRCHQWLEAPPDMSGLFVECPKCTSIVKVPVNSSELSVAAENQPPHVPQEEAVQDKLKGTTIRIELPPNLGLPDTPRRRFTIRRKS